MSTILLIYYYINLIFGLINIYYESGSNNFILNHWPSIAYSGILHVSAILCQFLVSYNHLQGAVNNLQLVSVQIFDIIATIIMYFAFVICIIENWIKRRRLCRMFKQLQYFTKAYFSNRYGIQENPHIKREIFKRIIFKIVACIMQIMGYYMEFIGRVRNNMECEVGECSTFIKITWVFEAFIDLYFILLDINIYMGLLFFYMCVQLVMERVKRLEYNIKIMQEFQNSDIIATNNIRQKLNRNIRKITYIVEKLKTIALEFFNIIQWQFSLILLVLFVSLVAFAIYFVYMILNLVIAKQIYTEAIILQLLYIIFLFMTILSNTLLLFNICECLVNSFREMSQMIYKIVVLHTLENKDLLLKDELALNVSSKLYNFL